MCCATTDYAMQSVLMQMGLKLLSVDGMVLRSIKHWVRHVPRTALARAAARPLISPRFARPPQVLRCSGCFTRQQSLDRQFCSKCGNASLVRLQMVINADGHQRILPEGKAPARVRSTNVRGTKFAMPAPQSGRHAKNLILAEDQLAEAREKARRQGKMKSFDVFDPDYDNEAHFGRTGKKGGARGGALQVGYGKRNPNDVRSRTKKR